MSLKLALNQQSVNALRELADNLGQVVKDICDATEELHSFASKEADRLGPHSEDIDNLMKLSDKAAESISLAMKDGLEIRIRSLANVIESFINKKRA